MMIINTRPEKQSAQLKILADDEGIEIRHIHLSQTKFKNLASNSIQKLENISSYKNIIFTSQNSVTSLMTNLLPENLDGKKIAAIGNSTKKTLNDMKIHVDICPKSDFTSESLLREIKKNSIINKKILIVKGIGGRNVPN